MDMYGVIAVCIIVPILVMSATYYMLKDLKFDDIQAPRPASRVKKSN